MYPSFDIVETSPVYINGKLIYISADFKLIALNAENGKLLWEKELLHPPSMRGFIVEIDKNEDENLYICVGYKLYGKKIEYVPSALQEQIKLKPIYKKLDGWSQNTQGIM